MMDRIIYENTLGKHWIIMGISRPSCCRPCLCVPNTPTLSVSIQKGYWAREVGKREIASRALDYVNIIKIIYRHYVYKCKTPFICYKHLQ